MSAVRLVVSSGHNRPNRSGLYLFDGSSVRLVDPYPCAGLSVRDGRFYRAAALRQGDSAEILVYDERGILRYHRIDDVGDPHDLFALSDGRVLSVSSRDNAIVAIAPDGSTSAYWRTEAPIDAWHVNCVAERDGRLYATAFGRFASFRGWHATRGAGTGILFDVESGEDVVSGLSQPHSPRWIDGAWHVCDSAEHSVVRVESNGHRFSVPVGGFSRGMCAIGEHVYVGVSTPREGPEPAAKGWISVLDRERWTEIDRVPMPCSSMYDLIEVDEPLLRGIETGFRFGSDREKYFGQLAMFEQVGVTPQRVWAVAEPLPAEMCRVAITADLPATLTLDEVARVTVRVQNLGDGFLVSAAPFPTEVCYRWFDAHGAVVGAGTWLHTRLPRVLTPRDSARFEVLVAPPPMTGTFTLRLTLLQEGVHWFDDVEPSNAACAIVEIIESRTES